MTMNNDQEETGGGFKGMGTACLQLCFKRGSDSARLNGAFGSVRKCLVVMMCMCFTLLSYVVRLYVLASGQSLRHR